MNAVSSLGNTKTYLKVIEEPGDFNFGKVREGIVVSKCIYEIIYFCGKWQTRFKIGLLVLVPRAAILVGSDKNRFLALGFGQGISALGPVSSY